MVALREEFARHHCIHLAALLDRSVIERLQAEVEQDGFFNHEHPGLKAELMLRPGRAWGLMSFLTNDPRFFEFIRETSGCGRIGSFKGRVYRMLPGPQHADSWHDDVKEGRMVAMSINLGTDPYAGGELQLRDRESKQILHAAANTAPGDALIFRIHPSLQHRVTAVEGTVAKTAYAGWFMPGPDSPLLRPGAAVE